MDNKLSILGYDPYEDSQRDRTESLLKEMRPRRALIQDPTDDGPEVEILRRHEHFYAYTLIVADQKRIAEHCRIRDIEVEFLRKIGAL